MKGYYLLIKRGEGKELQGSRTEIGQPSQLLLIQTYICILWKYKKVSVDLCHGGRFKVRSKICYLSVSTCYYEQFYPEECG